MIIRYVLRAQASKGFLHLTQLDVQKIALKPNLCAASFKLHRKYTGHYEVPYIKYVIHRNQMWVFCRHSNNLTHLNICRKF